MKGTPHSMQKWQSWEAGGQWLAPWSRIWERVCSEMGTSQNKTSQKLSIFLQERGQLRAGLLCNWVLSANWGSGSLEVDKSTILGQWKRMAWMAPTVSECFSTHKPLLFIWRDSICKTFIQGLIANKSLHGAMLLKDYTMAWPDNQCPIHALIRRDKMDMGELAHDSRRQSPCSWAPL